MQHLCTITGGKLVFADTVRFRTDCNRLKDGDYWLSLKRDRPHRSDQQNRYYWGVVVRLLAEHCGYTPDEMHDALRVQFLTVKREGLPTTMRRTSDLDTAEMEQFMSSVRQWASMELSIYIPEPNESGQPEWA